MNILHRPILSRLVILYSVGKSFQMTEKYRDSRYFKRFILGLLFSMSNGLGIKSNNENNLNYININI
jgi:hypothetical protein